MLKGLSVDKNKFVNLNYRLPEDYCLSFLSKNVSSFVFVLNVFTKRDSMKIAVGDINKTSREDGNQGQQQLIMQLCTSGGRSRHRFVWCLRSLL